MKVTSAEGATYESPEQARSASPRGNVIKIWRQGLKGRNNIPPFQGSRAIFIDWTRGDTLRACPWLSYSAPSALVELPRDGLTQNAVTWIKRVTGLRDVVDGQRVRAPTAARAESGNTVARRAGGLILS